MLVDEYQVTFWTRGQYPAAPPRIDIKSLPYGRLFSWREQGRVLDCRCSDCSLLVGEVWRSLRG